MKRESVFVLVNGHWQEFFGRMGVAAASLSGRHGPCPMCGGVDRFRFDNAGGRGTWICSRCGAGGPARMAAMLWGWTAAELAVELERFMGGTGGPRPEQKKVPPERGRNVLGEQTAMAAKWRRGRPLEETGGVWNYLNCRGILYTPDLRDVRWCGGWHGGLEMLALVTAADGRPCQLHRTLISTELEIERLLMRGEHPPGSAVRLFEHRGGPLGVAEGIETALSASQIYGIPVWAALNAGRLAKWEPPADASDITIFADNDENRVGLQAAETLARRLHERKFSGRIRVPATVGCDYNDVLVLSRTGDGMRQYYGRAQ